MIGSIKGKIVLKKDRFLLVETNGLGYKVFISLDLLTKTKVGDNISFFIHTHVREDAFDLYGFETYEEFEFFELLLGVSSIGPRSALGVLSVATLETLRKAIGTGDVSYLTKVSGIGKKTAEKIVVELRDKIGEDKSDIILRGEMDALEALKSLGYSQHEAREALKKVTATDTNTKVREALKILGRK